VVSAGVGSWAVVSAGVGSAPPPQAATKTRKIAAKAGTANRVEISTFPSALLLGVFYSGKRPGDMA